MCSLTLQMTFRERQLRVTLLRVEMDCSKLPIRSYLMFLANRQPDTPGLYLMATKQRQHYVKHWSGSIWDI